MRTIEESLKKKSIYFISENNKYLYINYSHSWKSFRQIDSITQPFVEREAYLDFCAKADTNTIAWFSGGIDIRWYQKDGVDYIMWLSNRGYECEPVKIKKRRKGYEIFSLRGMMFNNWISLDTSAFFTPTKNFKDTTAFAKRIPAERFPKFYDERSNYFLFEYNGAYIPD